MTVTFAPRAQADYIAIYAYAADRHGRNIAEYIITSIDEQCESLKLHPGIGRPRPDIAPDVRSLGCFSWLLFYRASPHGIEILRILHGARDITSDDVQPTTPDTKP